MRKVVFGSSSFFQNLSLKIGKIFHTQKRRQYCLYPPIESLLWELKRKSKLNLILSELHPWLSHWDCLIEITSLSFPHDSSFIANVSLSPLYWVNKTGRLRIKRRGWGKNTCYDLIGLITHKRLNDRPTIGL